MRVLVVVAHPDDEVLGCGATIARLVREGANVMTAILAAGDHVHGTDRDTIVAQSREAGRALGTETPRLMHFPDNRLDKECLLQLAIATGQILDAESYDLVFTHSSADLNIDHRQTHEAVRIATRAYRSTVGAVYCAEVLSATEWGPRAFDPLVYWAVTEDDIARKVQAMHCYSGELRTGNHPRTLEGIRDLARMRGRECGCDYAEAFELMREIKR